MRRVDIKLPEKNTKNIFRIYLDSDCVFEFKNKRKANDFLTSLNKFFQTVVEDLNSLFVELFTLFRNYYFAFDSRFDLNAIQECFDYFTSSLDKCVFNSPFQRVNIYVLIDLKKSFDYLETAISLLENFFISKRNTIERKNIYSKLRLLQMLELRFKQLQETHLPKKQTKYATFLRVA